jgi:Integrase core domain
MAGRILTVARFEDIQKRLAEGRGVREIARALNCSRKTVRAVRDGQLGRPDRPKAIESPLWMTQVDWPAVITDLGLGHPMKFLWEERAQNLTTYSNFWKQFYRKYPQYRTAASTLREFEPGERIEVDYAGDKIEWVDLSTGEVHEAYVFVAGLGFSQLLFAWASDDMKSRNWLAAHRRMFEAFGGVAHVLVPDCLKQGVLKCHIYDPDLNPAYAELASHYETAVVPARPGHPKDKAIVEGLVKILMRYFRFRYRRHTFTSLAEINRALVECIDRINRKAHTRFRVSRLERFEKLEKPALKALPKIGFEGVEWKTAKLHADCYASVEGAFYSGPHIHRGKTLRVKITENQVALYFNMEQLAVFPRDRSRLGRRHKIEEHFPANSQAYYEATPQKLLSQSRFVHPKLHELTVELFSEDVYGSIRRVQGLIRVSVKEINDTSRDVAAPRIEGAIAQMRRFNKIRVPYFQELLAAARKQKIQPDAAREIVRQPGNPMLRYSGGEASAIDQPVVQENLNL